MDAPASPIPRRPRRDDPLPRGDLAVALLLEAAWRRRLDPALASVLEDLQRAAARLREPWLTRGSG